MQPRPGCPVGCKYCMVTHIDARRSQWEKKHRWGINKTLLFLNRLPEDRPVKEFGLDTELFAGEYVGFQGITDPLWPLFSDDLRYMVELTNSTRMRKLVLVTKWAVGKRELKVLQGQKKVVLVVSVTGLEMLERTTTADRLRSLEAALEMGIDTLPLIHPYIHGLSDLTFLPKLKELGLKEVSVKGFRYNDRWMGRWGRKLIPEESMAVYFANQEQEVMLGNEYVAQKMQEAGLKSVPFREWVHRPNGVGGVSREEAQSALDRLMPLCVVSSSDPENVYLTALERRIRC